MARMRLTSNAHVKLGDIGTEFRLTVRDQAGNLVTCTDADLSFTFERPDGSTFDRTPSVEDVGTLVCVAGDDFDQSGRWYIHARVVKTDGSWRGDYEFPVYD